MIKAKRTAVFLLLVITYLTISSCVYCQEISVIPKPNSIVHESGSFHIDRDTRILCSPDSETLFNIATYASDQFEPALGYLLSIDTLLHSEKPSNVVFLKLDDKLHHLGTEGYQLDITEEMVHINAFTPAGVFYGIQTLRQLLPPEIESTTLITSVNWNIPALHIEDIPSYKWRGMLLDCCRHFMTKDFVKRYIDLLAYHKMNTLHWHLTEDQGWRIEIKKYPKLTEIGAWRPGENGEPYGGYYTQDDIREIVAYAESRFVNIVPEIELPGHATAALAAYPEYSCTGGPFEVGTLWGVYKDVYCPGNENTFLFLQDILDEVCELFSSDYIHIGGDECPKDRWQNHDLCQKRIQEEGLKDEGELQSYFIKRIEKYLNSKNKRLIGWDEIIEGGLPPEATVQVWRNMDYACQAAREGHDVIVSPTSHAYFDYSTENTSLRHVYTFEPTPDDLDDDAKSHIIGGECNMWTERAPQEKVDSKVFPRILAMAEVLWTNNSKRDFEDFHKRVRSFYTRLNYLEVDYGPESKAVAIHPEVEFGNNRVKISITSGEPDLAIHYTISPLTNEGLIPSVITPIYKEPFFVTKSSIIRTASFREGKKIGEPAECVVNLHKAFGKDVSIKEPYSYKYSGSGDKTVTDGISGSHIYLDNRWLGFEGVDFEAVIDLEEIKTVGSISASFLQNANSWIFMPQLVEYYVSKDQKEYDLVGSVKNQISTKDERIVITPFLVEFDNTECRYVKIRAISRGICPDWHPGAGGKAWIFVDEIVVE